MRKRSILITGIVFFSLVLVGVFIAGHVKGMVETEHKLHATGLIISRGNAIHHTLDHTLDSAYDLEMYVQRNDADLDNFDYAAKHIMENFEDSGLTSLQLAPNGIVSKVYPPVEHDPGIWHNPLEAHPDFYNETIRAINSKDLVVVGPIEYPHNGGGTGIIGRLPVYKQDGLSGEEEFWGLAIALINFDQFMETLNLETITDAGFDYELYQIDPDTHIKRVLASTKQGPADFADPINYEIEIPSGKWIISSMPTTGYWYSRPNLVYTLVITALLSLLLTVLTGIILEQHVNLKNDLEWRKQDVEERKKIEQELEVSNRLKDLFIDVVAHDLRSPLTVISAGVHLALEEGNSNIEELDLAVKSVTKIDDMIRDASKLAKLESGKEFEKKEYDLGEILRNAAKDLKDLAREKNMTINVQSRGKYKAKVNSLMNEVFSNLLSNAIKYGSENTEITANIEKTDTTYKVSIKDRGPGVLDKYKETIFNRFERVEKRGVQGTGLGLAIVKKILETHQGKVWVDDNPAGGSIFIVTIPK